MEISLNRVLGWRNRKRKNLYSRMQSLSIGVIPISLILLVLLLLQFTVLPNGSPPAAMEDTTRTKNETFEISLGPVTSAALESEGVQQTVAPREKASAAPSGLFVSLLEQSPDVRRARGCVKDPSEEDQSARIYRSEGISVYLEAYRCLGVGASTQHVQTTWEDRIPISAVKSLFPTLTPIHGGVRPNLLVEQARKLALLMGMDIYMAGLTAMLAGNIRRPSAVQDGIDALTGALRKSTEKSGRDVAEAAATRLQPKDVIVELGCGNAGLLFLMCPPVKELACFGTDFAPRLIQHGLHHMPWLDLRVAIFAPHLPTGSASGVLSHAVLMMLTPPEACSHIKEMLRLLKPRGRGVLWGMTVKPYRSRYHPSFFHEHYGGPLIQWAAGSLSFNKPIFMNSTMTGWLTDGKFLQFCPSLSQYVRGLKLILQNPGYPIYTPGIAAFFGVVLERSSIEWQENADATAVNGGSDAKNKENKPQNTSYPTELPLDAYRRHARSVEPVIFEQEGIHRYSDDAVPSLRHYMTLANTTALHMYKSKGPFGKFWSVQNGYKPAAKASGKRKGPK